MLVTRDFVILNLPKSGSSFVRAVVKAVYARRRGLLPPRWAGGDRFLRELILPNVRLPAAGPSPRPRDQHGIAAQIPPRYRVRPVISVMRDPYGKAVSEYRFRWWATHPPLPAAELAALFPGFPSLDFDAFLHLAERIAARKAGGIGPADIGNLTVEFVQFFFRDPARGLARLDDAYVGSGAFRTDMVPVTLLRQERLGEELAGFLAAHGFAADEAAFARTHPAVNVTPRDERADGVPGDVAWSAAGLARFRHRERHLFAMLAALGFRYPPPEPRAG